MTTATAAKPATRRTRKPAAPKPPTAAQLRKAKTRNVIVIGVRVLVSAYLALALSLSFVHIAALAGHAGADWQRWIAPVLIDTVVIIGKLSMLQAFTPKTRAAGKLAVYVAGTISLAANVSVGVIEHHYGNAAIGAAAVFGALWAEWHLGRMAASTAK